MEAQRYHEQTKHSPLSVRSGGHYLDWSNQPLPFKYYPQLDPIPLPVELPESGFDAGAALSGGVVAARTPLGLAQLARLLFFSAGVTRRVGRGGGMQFFRAAPSAGALYPVEIYVVCGELSELEAGVYHFGPIDFALRRLRTGDWRPAVARAAANDTVASAPLILVLTGIPWRTAWKYRERGYRHLFWDAGTILANLLALAETAGLPATVLAGFVDSEIAALLDIGAPDELPLAVVALGDQAGGEAVAAGGTRARAAAPLPEPLGLQVYPLSQRPVRYPLIEAVHAAGTLGTSEEVHRWRESAGRLAGTETLAKAAEPPGTVGTLEDVILQRGSTRRFARRSIPAHVLRWALRVAAWPVTADFVPSGRTLLSHLMAVHAVDGIELGAYRWTPDGEQLIHRDASRRRSSYLCLEQALGGDSAATVFHSADLAAVLGALGDRGYRAAQLEAGIACGRLHLAAYAAGIGATGLTFYDDEVRSDFETDEEPMLVTAIGPPDYQARRGRRPSEVPAVRLGPS